jgi:hypothetical protein
MVPKLTAAALFLGAGVSIGLVFLLFPASLLTIPDAIYAADVGGMASAGVLLIASVLLFWWPRVAYSLALASGLVAISWLIWTDLVSQTNPWIWLNYVGSSQEDRDLLAFEKLRILPVVTVVFAIACSAIRLLPSRWVFGERAVATRTWPVAAIAFVVLAFWFGQSVSPYQVPGIPEGPGVDLRILHVVQRGLSINETLVTARRNGSPAFVRTSRRLFQYQFESTAARVYWGESPAVLEHARALMRSPQLWVLHTRPAKELRAWNAEGWYVTLKDSHLVAFTSEYHTAPPREVTELFQELENLPGQPRPFAIRDICLGFCYDPVAALGFTYANDPAFALMRRNN